MLYSGPAFSAHALGDGIVELKFDLTGDSVNKLNQAALKDLDAATQALAKEPSVKGPGPHLRASRCSSSVPTSPSSPACSPQARKRLRRACSK